MVDVVVVGNRDRWTVSHEVPEGPHEAVPVVQVVQRRDVRRLPDHPGPAPLVDLVPREEEHVRVVPGHRGGELVVGEPDVARVPLTVPAGDVVTGEGSQDQLLPDPGDPSDHPFVRVRRGPLPRDRVVDHAVGGLPGAVPAFHPEVGRPAPLLHGCPGDLGPSAVPLHLQLGVGCRRGRGARVGRSS
jgi:hypothetical protein